MAAFPSGIEMRPSSFCNCWRSCSSLTELAVGLALSGAPAAAGSRSWPCCAVAGAPAPTTSVRASAARTARNAWRAYVIAGLPLLSLVEGKPAGGLPARSDGDGFAVGGLPAPRARAVAALDHTRLVDLRDDLAVAGEQGLGRAHLGAERQLALR